MATTQCNTICDCHDAADLEALRAYNAACDRGVAPDDFYLPLRKVWADVPIWQEIAFPPPPPPPKARAPKAPPPLELFKALKKEESDALLFQVEAGTLSASQAFAAQRQINKVDRALKRAHVLGLKLKHAGFYEEHILEIESAPSRFSPLASLKEPASPPLPPPSPQRQSRWHKKRDFLREEEIASERAAAKLRRWWAQGMALKKKLELWKLQQEFSRRGRREQMRRVLVTLDASAHVVVSLKVLLVAALVPSFVWPNQTVKDFSPIHHPPHRRSPRIRVQPQMADSEKDAQGEAKEVTADKKSNVELVTPVGESKAESLPKPKVDNEFRCLSAPRSKISEATFTDRWLTIKDGKWQKTSEVDSDLFSIDLPSYVLIYHKDSPNVAPFLSHTYWRGNMRIKLMVNSNIRQYGQLQLRFYYGANQDLHFDVRNNIYSGSQQTHCLVTANTSNTGELSIPFEYVFPVLNVRLNRLHRMENDLGKLVCKVVVPLSSSDTVQSFCSYSLAIAFESCEFSGMVDRTIVEAQMFSTAGALTALALSETLRDNNRDNPTISYTGHPVFPQNTGSWCIGGGLAEWTNVLRLDPRAVLPYPPTRVPDLDEMQIKHVNQIFGLIKIVEWDAQKSVGTELFSMDAAPISDKNFYPTTTHDNVLVRIFPPVTVLSSLFAFWRGDMELRIDVVGCAELSGRLLVAYAPRVRNTLSFKQAKNCSHSIFDLQENRQFVFNIPFVSDKLFWPRRTTISEEYQTVSPPGKVFIFVYNDLVANATIPAKCELCIYIRAGDTFELAVPASPSIGLCFEPNILKKVTTVNKAWAKEGYAPMYVGTWRGFYGPSYIDEKSGNGPPCHGPILRYGPGSDHVVQFTYTGDCLNKPLKAIQTLKDNIFTKELGFWYEDAAKAGQSAYFSYAFAVTYIVLKPDGNYIYGIPFASIESARDFASKPDKSVADYFKALEAGLHDVTNPLYPGEKFYFDRKLIISDTPVANTRYFIPDNPAFAPAVTVESQGGDERSSIQTTKSKPQDSVCYKTSASTIIFGEKFLDLKDVVRRYQRYASGYVKIDGSNFPEEFQMVILKFPAMPQGLALDIGFPDKIREYWNRTRDGPIPIIASGYRFFTGGLRFRLVLHVDPKKSKRPHNMKISVQHRPNITTMNEGVEITSSSSLGTDDLELPGYATHIQQDDMNSIVTVEVPFYLPSVRGFLQRPTRDYFAHNYSSLGEIAVGVQVDSEEKADLGYDIYYSLADDARFSVFQGFPPVIDITHIPNVVPTAMVSESLPKPRLTMSSDDEDFETVEPQMFDFIKKTKQAVNVINDTRTQNLIENVGEIAESVRNTISEDTNFLTTLKFKATKYIDLVINGVTNLVHCLINPTFKTIMVSIVSFLVQLKLISIDFISILIEKGTKLFEYLTSRKTRVSREQNEETVEPQMDDDAVHGYLSSLIAGVASLFGMVANFDQLTLKGLGKGLLKGIREFSLTANSLFIFFRNNLSTLKDIGSKLFSTLPNIAELEFLAEHDEDLIRWAKEVMILVDPARENEAFTNFKFAQRVYTAANQSCVFQLKMMGLRLHLSQQQNKVIENLTSKIIKLRDRLVKRHICSPVRFEPYSYELSGDSGLGKSHLLQQLPIEMLKAIKYKSHTSVIYDRAQGNQFWNNLTDQPVLNYDDKWTVAGPNFADIQLSELFQIKTRAIFNPPQAAVEDKERIYNPLIMQAGTNSAFPKLTSVLCHEAVYRRRDDLILVKRNYRRFPEATYGKDWNVQSLKKTHRALYKTDLDLTNYPHLLFQFAKDPSKTDTTYSGMMSYSLFRDALCQRFVKYYLEEMKHYEAAAERAMELYPTDEEVAFNPLNFKSWITTVESKIMGITPEEVLFRKDTLNDYYTIKNIKELGTALVGRINQYFSGNSIASTSTDVRFNRRLETVELGLDPLNPFSMCDDEDEILLDSIPDYDEVMVDAEERFDETNPFSTVEAQADDPQPVFCPHHFLHARMAHDSSYIDWDTDEEAWICDVNFFLQHYPAHCQVVFAGNFEEELMDGESKIKIPHGPCQRGSTQSCMHRDQLTMRALIRKYIHARQNLRIMYNRGADMSHIFPPHLMQTFMNEREMEREVGWMRKIWTTIKDSIMSVPWKEFFSIVGLIIMCFAPLFLFMGVEYQLSKPINAENWRLRQEEIDIKKKFLEMEAVQPEGHISGDHKVMRNAVIKNSIGKKSLTVQAQMSEEKQTSVAKLLKRNSFHLYMCTDERITAGRGLGIAGQYGLIVDHYFQSFLNFKERNPDAKFKLMLSSSSNYILVDFAKCNYHKFENSGLGLIHFPKTIPAFKDLRSIIASHDSHQYANRLGKICDIELDDRNVSFAVQSVQFNLKGRVKADGGELFGDQYLGDCYEYNGFSGKGKCGSILLSENLQAPLIGMHIAGAYDADVGYAETVFRSMFDFIDEPSVGELNGEGEVSNWFLDVQVVPVGKVPSAYAHRESEKSRIIPSELQLSEDNPFEVYTDVAVLSPKDPRIQDDPFSPMLKGCEFHGVPLLEFNSEHLEIAHKDILNMILSKCISKRQKVGVLTIDQACGGIPDNEGYEHLEWRTSEGFPFTGMRPRDSHDKRWLFNMSEDNTYVSVKPLLAKVMEQKHQNRLDNIIPPTVFVDCLKDCTISKEKVLVKGKTRIFSMAPVDFTIQERQYTMDFVIAYMQCRLDLEHAVGINPDSIEWTRLAEKLLFQGSKIVTGDYSKFGDSIPPEIIQRIFQIIIKWYRYNGAEEPEIEQILTIMSREVSTSFHLMFNFLYQTVCGQPSGNSLTVIINSLTNSFYLRLAWLTIMQNTKYSGLDSYKENVTLFSYGDDVILSVSDVVCEAFNAVSLCDFFACYGLKFTNADKSSTIVPYMGLGEADFLKRGFMLHPKPERRLLNIMLAPLSIPSIEDTSNWIWSESYGRSDSNCPTFRDMCVQVSKDASRNAYSRGPEYYDDFVLKLETFWQKRNVFVNFPTWDQLDNRVFDLQEDITFYSKKITK